MHCHLETAGKRFAKLVPRREQPFAIRRARTVEFGLLRIGFVIGKAIFS
jgi:hypothetical protein